MNTSTRTVKFSHLGCIHPTQFDQFLGEIKRARLQGSVRVVMATDETRHGKTASAVVEVRKGCREETRAWAIRMMTYYQSI